jgi:hypothetical protein
MSLQDQLGRSANPIGQVGCKQADVSGLLRTLVMCLAIASCAKKGVTAAVLHNCAHDKSVEGQRSNPAVMRVGNKCASSVARVGICAVSELPHMLPTTRDSWTALLTPAAPPPYARAMLHFRPSVILTALFQFTTLVFWRLPPAAQRGE